MAVLFVVAQAADLLTWLAFHPAELNPVVRMAPLTAVVAKVALMAIAAPLGLYLTGTRYRGVGLTMLRLGIIMGTVGAVSNL